MGIRFLCPHGHKLNVKAFQAGRRGICPFCGARFQIPLESTLPVGRPTPAMQASGAPVEGTQFEQELELHLQQAEAPASLPDPAERREEAVQPAAASASTVAEPAADAPAAEVPAAAAPLPASAPPADPLAEMPNAVWYVRPPSGGQFGPAQPGVMRTWLSEGRVSSETLVWREGWADWKEAGSVFLELRPAAESTEPPPIAAGDRGEGASFLAGPRRRKRGPNVSLIVVLVTAVLLLLVVLIWLLRERSNQDQPGQGKPMTASACWEGSRLSFPAGSRAQCGGILP